MVCYLIKFGNEKPPRERFVVVLYFIPVCTGNAELLKMWGICNAVYPCAYRELDNAPLADLSSSGLFLCIQGTQSHRCFTCDTCRFIPVYTGNTVFSCYRWITGAVYPCVYREHSCDFGRR